MVDGWSDLLKPLQCPRGFSTCKCRNVLELQGFLDCLRPIEYPPQIRAARTTGAPNAASTCWRTAFGTRFQGGLASTPVRDICSSSPTYFHKSIQRLVISSIYRSHCGYV